MPAAASKLPAVLDRTLGVLIAALVAGTLLGFGGAVWWAPAWIGLLAGGIALVLVFKFAVTRSWRLLRSPLAGLGAVAIAVALGQSIPLPAHLVGFVSPGAREVNTTGTLIELARGDDPEFAVPSAISGRATLTIDRSATLRWMGAASACLILFVAVGHFVDRLERLYLVWGSVVAVFLLNTAIVAIQILGQADGLYGFIEPGKGPAWGPNYADAIDAPGETSLRPIGAGNPTRPAIGIVLPDRVPRMGTLMGGPGAYLALGSLGLPLALAIALQLMAPRGSREGLWSRLMASGQGSLVVLLIAFTVASAFLCGLIGGSGLAWAFAGPVALAGSPTLLGTGLRWRGLLVTATTMAAVGGGALLARSWESVLPGVARPQAVEPAAAREVWGDAIRIARGFPIAGVGAGAFATIQPYYKTRDAASTTAMNSLLQWWVELGFSGLAIGGVAVLWCLWRLPRAVRRIGSADRALAGAMLGAGVGFVAFACFHWSVELVGIALAGSAFAATANRWLAGGTDLFVERG